MSKIEGVQMFVHSEIWDVDDAQWSTVAPPCNRHVQIRSKLDEEAASTISVINAALFGYCLYGCCKIFLVNVVNSMLGGCWCDVRSVH